MLVDQFHIISLKVSILFLVVCCVVVITFIYLSTFCGVWCGDCIFIFCICDWCDVLWCDDCIYILYLYNFYIVLCGVIHTKIQTPSLPSRSPSPSPLPPSPLPPSPPSLVLDHHQYHRHHYIIPYYNQDIHFTPRRHLYHTTRHGQGYDSIGDVRLTILYNIQYEIK